MPSRNHKKREKQRSEYLQKQNEILSQENKAKRRARYQLCTLYIIVYAVVLLIPFAYL